MSVPTSRPFRVGSPRRLLRVSSLAPTLRVSSLAPTLPVPSLALTLRPGSLEVRRTEWCRRGVSRGSSGRLLWVFSGRGGVGRSVGGVEPRTGRCPRAPGVELRTRWGSNHGGAAPSWACGIVENSGRGGAGTKSAGDGLGGAGEGSLSLHVLGTLVPTCSEEGCERPAAFELHVPWAENRVVCAPHARVLSRQDGIVADALPDAADELP